MTAHDWIAVIGLFITVCAFGLGAYLNTRERLVRIEAILLNGMTHRMADMDQAIRELVIQLAKHIGEKKG